MLRNKKELIKDFEILCKQVNGEADDFTEHGLNVILNQVKAVIYACPEKIANAVLEEVE